ncbi:hypothetical protein ACFSBZ_11795 [Amnibacterium flavum]|uniref:DNA helicase n=1 Tax=Amnibacterium flavum TaxID=2173173 RepID=A0A2V1HUV6_9MICO|nr:hypothetical protein [Amnibacterium flavum]PVZ95492.1 hypothetical protein DDQ50_03010 [Amnibacterium flavum]
MGLSRKRKKELRKLKGHAEELWQEQQEVLERASAVIREASRQAGHLTREEVVPRVSSTYDEKLRPGVEKGRAFGGAVIGTAKDKIVDDVLPAVATVAGSALSILDIGNDVRKRLEKTANEVGKRVQKQVVPAKKGPGPGTYIAIGLGVVALAGIAYAAWQTFRADDDLWIADDEPEAAPDETAPKA